MQAKFAYLAPILAAAMLLATLSQSFHRIEHRVAKDKKQTCCTSGNQACSPNRGQSQEDADVIAKASQVKECFICEFELALSNSAIKEALLHTLFLQPGNIAQPRKALHDDFSRDHKKLRAPPLVLLPSYSL